MKENKNEKMNGNNNLKRGDIYFADFGIGNGRVQGSQRPAIIISNNKCNDMSPVITVVALTSNVEKAMQKKLPTQIFISKLTGIPMDSIALCEQPRSIDKSQIDYNIGKIGIVDTETMILIEKALMVQVGINSSHKPTNQIINSHNNNNTNTKFDYEHAKQLILCVAQLDKLSKELNMKIPSKKIILEQYINYCQKFNVDYKLFAAQIKSNNINNNSNKEKVRYEWVS